MEFFVGNIWYTTLTDSTVRTGKLDTSTNHNAFLDIPENNSLIVIPQNVTNPKNQVLYTVTQIGDKSFRFDGDEIILYDYELPETIIEIGKYAFDLTHIKEYPDLPNLKSIGYLAFGSNLMGNFSIQETVERIDDAAFAYNLFNTLEMIEIPENSIYFSIDEQGALYDFRKTRIIWVPNKVHFNIPLTVQYIPNHLFAMNHALSEIIIPPACSIIGYYSFFECINLTKITITGNVFDINPSCVFNCTNITIIDYHGTVKINNIIITQENMPVVYTCNEYKWEKAFGIETHKQGNCPEMNIIHKPTCDTNSLNYLMGSHLIAAVFLS